jgi:ribosomal protein RSM22 (predicted rRNA methylase)
MPLDAIHSRVMAVTEACVAEAGRLHASALAPDVSRLSALFTDHRGGRSRTYMRDPGLRRAYLAFWVPHNVARLTGLLQRARSEGHLDVESPAVLDLGAGPLSGVLAAWCVFGRLSRAVAVDLSRPALEHGQAILRAVGADVGTLSLVDAALDGPPARWAPTALVDIVIAANVLNEVSSPRDLMPRRRLLEQAARCVRSGGRVLVTEPAMRMEARALMALRDELVADGAVVLSPCRGARTCPLLSTRGDWCHQDIAFSARPPSYRALERAARLPKDALAVAHLLVAVGAASAPTTGLRLIGGLMTDDRGIERRYACGRSLRTLTGNPRLPPGVAAADRGVLLDDSDDSDNSDDSGAAALRSPPRDRPEQSARGARGRGSRRSGPRARAR